MTCLAQVIELDPTKAQAEYFAQACGASRTVYNKALEEWQKRYKAGQKPKENEVRKWFTANKDEIFPWHAGLSSFIFKYAIANLGTAFNRLFKKQNRYPARKKKGKSKDSFRADDGHARDGFSYSDTHVTIPKLGAVRLKHPPRFVGRTVQAYVSRDADRWFLSITTDVGENYRREAAPVQRPAVGVDLGLTTAVTLSSGEKIDSPKPLKARLKRLRRLSRRHSRKVRGSNNRRKAAMRLARHHRKVRNTRKDWTHKVTTKLCRENQAVVIEDLNVKGMMKNENLARAISDIGFYEFRRQLTYKAPLYGTELVVADRWMPSSKLCSSCGVKREGVLSLSVRAWKCPACGARHDRDVNAAMNLENLVRRVTPEYTSVESGVHGLADKAGAGCRSSKQKIRVVRKERLKI